MAATVTMITADIGQAKQLAEEDQFAHIEKQW